MTAGPWVRCFQEVTDPLAWDGNQYPTMEIYWSKLTWNAVQTEHASPDCQLKVNVTSHESPAWWGNFEITSAGFGFRDEAVHQTAWRGLSLANEQARRWTLGGGGWNDAGGGYGECRSHGTFLSGMAWLLQQRRPEMTTQESSDLVSALDWGIDYLVGLGEAEYDYVDGSGNRRLDSHQAYQQDRTHWVWDSNGNEHPLAREGHLFQDHHTRPQSDTPGEEWWKDIGNDDSRVFRACSGLIDAAITLWPFDQALANDAYVQARKSRDYLESRNPDPETKFDVADRFQASWLFQLHDYRTMVAGDPLYDTGYTPDADLDAGQAALEADLIAHDPTTGSSNKLRKWVLGDKTLAGSTRLPIEGLLGAIDQGLTPNTYGNSFVQARDDIIDGWYKDKHQNSTLNPLRIARFWPDKSGNVRDWKGDKKWMTDNIIMEVLAMSWMAEQVGPGDPDHDLLVELASGNLGYLLGMHPGVRGRYANPPSDEEYVGAGFLNALTSLTAAQMWYDDNIKGNLTWWLTPSVENPLHGDDPVVDFPAPEYPPWTFTPHKAPDGETYILPDGILLVAAEALGRVLHPQLVLEAEDYTTGSQSFNPVVNNDPAAGLLNGGESLVGLDGGDTITHDFIPPAKDGMTHQYRILLRVANPTATTQLVLVTVNPGPGQWSTAVTVPVGPSSQIHDYIVVEATLQSSPLLPVATHTLQLEFPGTTGGLSLDSTVVKQHPTR